MQAIEAEHPQFAARRLMYRKYRDLYAGGEQLRANAVEYLMRRNREPEAVYQERLNRVFYENYIGSIIDWYAATLMRREPVLLCEGENERGKSFYAEFTEDCDRRGANLADYFRRQLIQTLTFGESYTVVDFPRCSEPSANRLEEDEKGASRAYLVSYTPEDLINWSHSEDGTLDWVVLRSKTLKQERVSDSRWREITRWAYYDRESFRVYESTKSASGSDGPVSMVDEGRHGLAGLRRVPIFTLRVSEGLWLMNKAALLQLEHFNKSNALSWAMTMSLFAQPVIFSDRNFQQAVGESYYIQLGQNDKFGWTEPQGHVFEIASHNLSRLKDEIYRVCYVISQAADPKTAAAQSGLSKLRDFSITQEVLRAYGDAVKETLRDVLRTIESARDDKLRIDIAGLDEFNLSDFAAEVEDAKALLELGTESPTLRRQILKRLALLYLCDASQELKNRIADEIDAAG